LRWPEFGARCTEEMATGGSGGCNRRQPGQLELRLIGARGRGDRGECMGCSPTVGANGDERKPAGSGRTTASTSVPRGGASPMRFQRRAGALEVWLGVADPVIVLACSRKKKVGGSARQWAAAVGEGGVAWPSAAVLRKRDAAAGAGRRRALGRAWPRAPSFIGRDS
jgi:hypothetical protein